jgi:glycosyltransferase involved in cell wall biosynthesis
MLGVSGSHRTPHVLLVEARLPAYRLPTWSALRDELHGRGVGFDLAVGTPARTHARRNDERQVPWALRCPTAFHTIGPLDLRNITSAPLLGDLGVTHVILEQALTDLGTYRTWITARRRATEVALLGHGRNYSHSGTSLRNELKARLTLRADWFFAYTAGGADQLVRKGFPVERITVIGNSTSVPDPPRDDELEAYSRGLGLPAGPTALFLGALQSRKGLDELCEAAVVVAGRHSGFRLLLGGDGPLAASLAEKSRSGYPITPLGHLDQAHKALALAACDFVVVPRQLGLVVVDALAAGRPIVTMSGQWHGPESEYLTDGGDSIWSEPSVSGLAESMCRLIESPDLLAAMQERAKRAYTAVSMDAMVSNFADGVCAWIEAGDTS